MNSTDDSIDKKILTPFTYILKAESNAFCTTKMPEILNHWMRIPEDKLNAIRNILKIVMNSIIMFDDIQDGSLYRRAIKSAHCVYGVPQTLNASIHALFLALEDAHELGHPRAARIFSDQIISYMRGQGIDIYWRDNHITPTEEEYKEMALNKLGSIIMLVYKFMELFSSFNKKLTNLNKTLALYLTIRDDYYNICKPEALEEKERIAELECMKDTHICEDITEGKYTWPIIHALKSPHAAEILNILKHRTRDVKMKQRCLMLMEQAGSIKYTRDTIIELDRELRHQIDNLGGNPMFEALLDSLFT